VTHAWPESSREIGCFERRPATPVAVPNAVLDLVAEVVKPAGGFQVGPPVLAVLVGIVSVSGHRMGST
jgi:hypothetical protein